MEAGRELDTVIAIKILGWKVIETDESNGDDNLWLSKDGQNVFADKFGEAMELPHYSTDISDAFPIADKLRLGLMPSNSGKWAAGQNKPATSPKDFSYAETAPHAICLAALSAIDPK